MLSKFSITLDLTIGYQDPLVTLRTQFQLSLKLESTDPNNDNLYLFHLPHCVKPPFCMNRDTTLPMIFIMS